MGILIGADFVPTKTNENNFINSSIEYLLGAELCHLLNTADYRIFNLEVPLTNDLTPILKCGPNLIAKTDTAILYKKAKVDLFTLANNHIMDQGVKGYKSTINILDGLGIDYVGCGDNLTESIKPVIIQKSGKKIGIYACVEHEYSVATESTPGANPFDPLESYDHICQLADKTDYIIVLYHGGKEHYRYPSPELQKRCRKFISKGANLVICQHSHCIGCKEEYLNGTIIYGQGNFLFDGNDNECWQTGLLVEIMKDFSLNYIPLEKHGNKIQIANGQNAKKIIDEFELRSQQIKQDNFIINEYNKFADSMITNYLLNVLCVNNNLFFKVINRLTHYKFGNMYIRKKYKNKNLCTLENMLECESIREAFLTGVKLLK